MLRRSFPHNAGPAPVHPPVLQDPDEAWAWLRAEAPNLLAAVAHASEHAQPRRAIALTADLAPILYTDVPRSQAIALHTAAAATAESLGDQRSLAWALAELAHNRPPHGGFDELKHALKIYQNLDEQSGQAYALLRLGQAQHMSGDYAGAVGNLEQALQIYQSLADRRGQAQALAGLGDARRVSGDYPGAVGDLEQALQIYQDFGERSGQAYVLLRLGDVRRLIGDYRDAVSDLEHALQIYQSLGDRHGQANTLTGLVMVRLPLTGDYQGLARDLGCALNIYADIGDLNGQAQALTILGRVRLSTGDLKDAADQIETALDMFSRIGCRGNETWALNDYAAVIAATGNHQHARRLYHDALRLAGETSQLDEEALALEGIGNCDLRADDDQGGVLHLEQALKIFQRVGMKPDADRVRNRLSAIRGIS